MRKSASEGDLERKALAFFSKFSGSTYQEEELDICYDTVKDTSAQESEYSLQE